MKGYLQKIIATSQTSRDLEDQIWLGILRDSGEFGTSMTITIVVFEVLSLSSLILTTKLKCLL